MMKNEEKKVSRFKKAINKKRARNYFIEAVVSKC